MRILNSQRLARRSEGFPCIHQRIRRSFLEFPYSCTPNQSRNPGTVRYSARGADWQEDHVAQRMQRGARAGYMYSYTYMYRYYSVRTRA